MVAQEVDDFDEPMRDCLLCRESWPDDEEFYRPGHWICIACEAELADRPRRQVRERVRAFRARQRQGAS